jgi:ArsR family transcriptional regulator
MSNNQTVDTERLSGMFKALANPNRLDIFLRLASLGGDTACCTVRNGGEPELITGAPCACVGDLGRDLGIVPSTVSHHIKELNRAGLITLTRRGQQILCRVEPQALEALRNFFDIT